GRVGQELEDRECGHRLAGARLADERHRLARFDVEGDAVDRERLAPRLPEGDREVFDGKQRPAHWKVFRGSKASRTASPVKIRSDSRIASVKKPVRPSHGACTLALPCASISPSDGEPGGGPKPRKSSAVSVMTEPDTMKGRKVSVATIAFGSRCRNMRTV